MMHAARQPDFRSLGTPAQFLREFFARADRGYTRREIREMLRSDPRFAARLKGGKASSRPIAWLIERGEIVEIGGLLYGARSGAKWPPSRRKACPL